MDAIEERSHQFRMSVILQSRITDYHSTVTDFAKISRLIYILKPLAIPI